MEKDIIFIDTHIVVWLVSNKTSELSQYVQETLNSAFQKNILYIPLICSLELEYLYEIGRIKLNSQQILDILYKQTGITLYNSNYSTVIKQAHSLKWTRDVFDRLIVAEASMYNAVLITKDKKIRENYKLASW